MRHLFPLLFGRSRGSAARAVTLHPSDPPLRVDRPMAVIGDLHGMEALLERMLSELARIAPAALPVFVGDLIDRGPGSAQVLARVRALVETGRAICLMGNHEAMMLDFLEAPTGPGSAWLRHGGIETLASFGLTVAPDVARDPAALTALAGSLRAALGPTEGWLRSLPRLHLNGTVAVVHAAADPARAIAAQDPEVLIWGHPSFERQSRRDGLWIAHGHVVVPAPRAGRGRIATDTGAWETGRLSAALIGLPGAPLQFLTLR